MPHKDRERRLKYYKEYDLKNKEYKSEYRKKKWLELKKDPEKYNIHQQKTALYDKAYRAKNRQKLLEKSKQYHKKRGYLLKKEQYDKIMNDPMLHKKYKEKNRILGRKRREKIKKDPELHEKFLEKIRIYRKKQYSKNREVILRRLRDWYNNRMKPETKEKIRQWKRKWERKQRATNPAFKIKYNLKSRLGELLKKQRITKLERTLDYIGCSFEDLKNHLEKQFQPGMSWENRVEWHIDHIIPVNYFIKNFDFTDINVQKKCFHYTNLRPLWKFDNLSKGSKIISGDFTSPKT